MHAEVVLKLERLKTTVHEKIQALDSLRVRLETGEAEVEKLRGEQLCASSALRASAEVAEASARIKVLEEKISDEVALQPVLQSAAEAVTGDGIELRALMDKKLAEMDADIFLLEVTRSKLADASACSKERFQMATEDYQSLTAELHELRRKGQSDLRNGWMRSATQANLQKNKELEASIRALSSN